jgi:hypothetical protein
MQNAEAQNALTNGVELIDVVGLTKGSLDIDGLNSAIETAWDRLLEREYSRTAIARILQIPDDLAISTLNLCPTAVVKSAAITKRQIAYIVGFYVGALSAEAAHDLAKDELKAAYRKVVVEHILPEIQEIFGYGKAGHPVDHHNKSDEIEGIDASLLK